VVRRVIYIVDDDRAVRESLSRLMQAVGFETRVFDTPERLLAEVQRGASGCILLDMSAPEASRRFRDRLREKGIDMPVIALSVDDSEMTRLRARRLGAQHLLRKPVDDQALLDAINWVTEAGRNEPPGRSEVQE
jgi:two-component system response regulator FixJ